jgi:hypothetical protein
MTLAAACGVALFRACGEADGAREMERLLDACLDAERKGGAQS